MNLPLTQPDNKTLVYNYKSLNLNVYLKDIVYDGEENPEILFLISNGYESGPKNNPHTWRVAQWTGDKWEINSVTNSENNYDMDSLWLIDGNSWHIIAATETGPKPYNPGGEVAFWTSYNMGRTWRKIKQLTSSSERNHTYVRRPLIFIPNFMPFGRWTWSKTI